MQKTLEMAGNGWENRRSFGDTKCWNMKYIIEGSLEVKLPTIWTDEKQRWEEPEKSEEERRSRFAKR